jgi:hypothetical protein
MKSPPTSFGHPSNEIKLLFIQLNEPPTFLGHPFKFVNLFPEQSNHSETFLNCIKSGNFIILCLKIFQILKVNTEN